MVGAEWIWLRDDLRSRLVTPEQERDAFVAGLPATDLKPPGTDLIVYVRRAKQRYSCLSASTGGTRVARWAGT
jgi:hypothetical protein